MCKLNKSLYGLKQASKMWFSKLSFAVLGYDFVHSKANHSLFILSSNYFTFLLAYVDDVIVGGNNLQEILDLKTFHDEK